ncbi:MAG: NnrU family protein [Myxococcota bacterium]
MTSLVFAALFFFAIHVGIAGSQLRDRLVSRLGEKGYLGFFSLLSIVGITWLCWAYSLAPTVWWATPAEWTRPVAWGLVFVAFLFVGVGAATPSPTAMGGDAQIDSEDAVRGILRITRHPVLWGIAIWAAAHAIANPDVASAILFVCLLAVALAGPPTIDAKRSRRFGERWGPFAAVTSRLPFGAILSGRNRLVLSEIGAWRVALAVGLYALFAGIHPWLFGVPAIG